MPKTTEDENHVFDTMQILKVKNKIEVVKKRSLTSSSWIARQTWKPQA